MAIGKFPGVVPGTPACVLLSIEEDVIVSISTEGIGEDLLSSDGSPQPSAAAEAFQSIEVDGGQIRIHNFCFENADLADYLTPFSPDQRPAELIKAIEVGLFFLSRATVSQDTQFVKHQAERVINAVELTVGALPKQLRDELTAKIGTGDGQVLKPVNDLIGQVTKMIGDRMTEVKTLFAEKLDPERDTSSLGQTLKAVSSMVDPQRKDSIQSTIEAASQKPMRRRRHPGRHRQDRRWRRAETIERRVR